MKVVVEEGISRQLETFWQLENLGIEPVNENLNRNDDKILQEFEENIQFRDGRYVVQLPWKELDDFDKNVTKFLWTDNPESFSESLEVLRFNRVLFGINSSPFLLTATIKYHLKKYSSLSPQTHELLNKFLYVDDVLGGQSTVSSAYTTSVECVQIFNEANIPLHKWATNSAELRELWEKNGFSTETSSNSIGQNMINYKVLGISWDTDRDVFYFDIESLLSFISKRTDTKRFLLQVAGRIFDPLGFIAPYVIRLKILIQSIWETGLLWDQEMPLIIKKPFNEWCHELKDLRLVSIPRFYDFTDSNATNIQLHCFSDSSKKAYGTVIYFRVIRTDGTITTSFVTSKSRVAPLKTLSLPRLELMGALLSARIEDIQKLTEPSKWHHCPGKENPADIISRGISVRELKKIVNFGGMDHPGFNKQNSFGPNSRNKTFINNTRDTLKKSGTLETEELKKSEEYWIKEIQKETYASEIIDLEKAPKVSDCSKIRSLVPCLDDRKILRIKGRLDESELSLDEKQPILLPSNSKFTELLILFYQNNSYKTTFHCHKEESDDSITSVSSCQTETESQRVLLQTASVVARYNKQFRNCRLLADTAAQRSLVERKFSRLLTLPVIRKEKLSIYSFGDKSPVEKVFNVVKIRLENKDDPNSYLEIEALETEKYPLRIFPRLT
ncbi:integrase catalytic domain-containing protein [Trichonephila clavipes]|uniref:Integrase catalytic domain-containing protein n=1 Tax=Trichonephila clavipes TaxID=2585209 RepID=A0A8X7BLZ1_TRICX|nr:integrase catalytic domain-containing protein [Trichonephila clavipes]